jgi:hypothetical protein
VKSELQLQGARANGAKSKGPVNAEVQANSSRNNIRHARSPVAWSSKRNRKHGSRFSPSPSARATNACSTSFGRLRTPNCRPSKTWPPPCGPCCASRPFRSANGGRASANESGAWSRRNPFCGCSSEDRPRSGHPSPRLLRLFQDFFLPFEPRKVLKTRNRPNRQSHKTDGLLVKIEARSGVHFGVAAKAPAPVPMLPKEVHKLPACCHHQRSPLDVLPAR